MKLTQIKSSGVEDLFASDFKVKLYNPEINTDKSEVVQLYKTKAEDQSSEETYGYLAGYMSTFGNEDLVYDVIKPGAFTKTLKERKPRVLLQHDQYSPIGVFEEIYEDKKGLFGVIKLNLDTQKGLETYNLYKSGAMDSFSVGMRLVKYSVIERESGFSGLDISEVRLMEVSAVTFPANEQAVITDIKTHYEDIKEQTVSEQEITKEYSFEDLLEYVNKSKEETILSLTYSKKDYESLFNNNEE